MMRPGSIVRLMESPTLPLLGEVLRCSKRKRLAYVHWNVREEYIPGSLAGCESLEEWSRLEVVRP